MDQSKKIMVRVRAVIIYEGKLFVVRHNENLMYALPGGHMEWGEGIKESLKREMVEELGVVPQIGKLLFVNNFIEKETDQSIEFFFEILNSSDFTDIENLNGTHRFELLEICWAEKGDGKVILPNQLRDYLDTGTLVLNDVRFIK